MSNSEEESFEGSLIDEELSEHLSTLITTLMTPAIDGVYAVVEATDVRRDRYLLEHNGDVEKAAEAAISYSSKTGKLKTFLVSLLPGLSLPGGIIVPVWNQIRIAALVAALYGFDTSDSEVQCEILWCLVEGDLKKAQKAVFVDVGHLVARKLVKKIVSRSAAGLVSKLVPFGSVFDVLTENSAQVGVSARKFFRKKANEREGKTVLARVKESPDSPEERLRLLEQAESFFKLANRLDLVHEVKEFKKAVFKRNVGLPNWSVLGLIQSLLKFIYSMFKGLVDLLFLVVTSLSQLFTNRGHDDL
eukprot:m.216247 g.216247  ORF g.216247 m.216247 type:complete len:303 (+) comp39855_c0_seq1:106-1014(+)